MRDHGLGRRKLNFLGPLRAGTNTSPPILNGRQIELLGLTHLDETDVKDQRIYDCGEIAFLAA